MLSFKEFLHEKEECPLITASDLKEIEKFADKMFKEFGIDFEFTKHFKDRMSDDRNKPCIAVKELRMLFVKLYHKNKGNNKTLANYKNTEAVIKDLQSKLNMPVVFKYDRKNDEVDVVAKTIMRKKDFKTPDKEIRI